MLKVFFAHLVTTEKFIGLAINLKQSTQTTIALTGA